MKIKELKSFNKPIEKLIYNGPNSLSNDELLAILINTGTKNESCIDIAKRILNSITNLSNLTDITVNQLIKFKGIKEKKAALIVAAFELVKRCNESYNLGETIERKEDLFKILKPKIVNLHVEHIFIFYLNNKLNIIKLKEIENGNPSNIVIPIRSIVKEALMLDSPYIIISHNHPSGDVNPSQSDIDATIELDKALQTVDIGLLDHVIVSKNNIHSLKEYCEF